MSSVLGDIDRAFLDHGDDIGGRINRGGPAFYSNPYTNPYALMSQWSVHMIY